MRRRYLMGDASVRPPPRLIDCSERLDGGTCGDRAMFVRSTAEVVELDAGADEWVGVQLVLLTTRILWLESLIPHRKSVALSRRSLHPGRRVLRTIVDSGVIGRAAAGQGDHARAMSPERVSAIRARSAVSRSWTTSSASSG